MKSRWLVRNVKADFKKVAARYNISEVVARILFNRGIYKDSMIKSFLNPTYKNLNNPDSIIDIKKGVSIIEEKIKTGKKIRIVGDYDVDGVMSVYILYTALKKCRAKDVDYEIPDRIKDGYGINKNIIDDALRDDVDTILTCDNGISATEEIKYAKDNKMTVIVTDHHDIPFSLDEDGEKIYTVPKADAIINPKIKESRYPFRALCGASVAFKFVQLLFEKFNIDKKEILNYIEFLSIATVCDVMELILENRIFVKNGLSKISDTKNVGLRCLMAECDILDKKINTYHIGFVLGPCINASGRLESAKIALDLFLEKDLKKAQNIAKELVSLNKERKDMTSSGVDKAVKIIEENNMDKDKVLVVYVDNIHESLAGIIAGRIKEKYNLPTIILTDGKDKVKGSARSIDEYNMFEELSKCKELLSSFGGHKMAAGLSLDKENIDKLREELNKNTSLTDKDVVKKIVIDENLPLENINYKLINEIKSLEPFGMGNSKPLFGVKGVNVINMHVFGKDKNVIKLKIKMKNGLYIDAIHFGDVKDFEKVIEESFGKEELNKLYNGFINDVYLDLVYYPTINEYNGNSSVQIIIDDYRGN
ncbi:single-stranded-DNA-specific exonuclease RecJ [Clostridium sp. BJN0001]|uniref:single-stranded-DNA-specific exonuclease RecJ n=1 Tax=Clostridium sp. BJN0001 TaxID=2930219 RepID=UPI001FD1605C|nr:single-stranded-DNA-specific exonuclease RecJ [Clostridium sp. BJN0001]